MIVKTSANATDLLSVFSGGNAEQYAPHFRFSGQARIVNVEIHAVGTEKTTARYTDEPEAWKQVNNILRITTADGYEGVSGVDDFYEGAFSEKLFLELESVAADLLALETLDPVEVGAQLAKIRPELSDQARSTIDICLWDLAARKAGRPLHELLGSRRDSIEPYASLPFYDSISAHIDAVNEYAELGYNNFKFHIWGKFEKDTSLVDAIQKTFRGSSYHFMIDLEGAYGFDDALKLGEKLDEQFIWLEGPIDDAALEQYRDLRTKLSVPIIPAGYDNYSPEFIRNAIEKKSWDAGRFDVTMVGGYSKALELMIIANAASLPMEIQSWGHSLAQAANLHLMLANERTRYFEAPMPQSAFEFGMKNGNLLNNGRVVAPAKPGLGIEVDWDRLTDADFYMSSKQGARREEE